MRSNPYNRGKMFERGRADASNKRGFKLHPKSAPWKFHEYADGYYSIAKVGRPVVLSMLDHY